MFEVKNLTFSKCFSNPVEFLIISVICLINSAPFFRVPITFFVFIYSLKQTPHTKLLFITKATAPCENIKQIEQEMRKKL